MVAPHPYAAGTAAGGERHLAPRVPSGASSHLRLDAGHALGRDRGLRVARASLRFWAVLDRFRGQVERSDLPSGRGYSPLVDLRTARAGRGPRGGGAVAPFHQPQHGPAADVAGAFFVVAGFELKCFRPGPGQEFLTLRLSGENW